MKSLSLFSLLLASTDAFPWVVNAPGVDSSALSSGYRAARLKRQQAGAPGQPGSASTCPFNANHQPAAPYNPKYPYNGAHDGLPGKGVGGYQVPAPGDDAHKFVAPTKNDIRGPCPGLNAAANHGFLAHDGIVTYNELVDAQQNVYNVGYDLANLLALLGLTLTDGDIVTEKLSIGCDATTRTSFNPVLTGSEPGLDGHNKFEADSSLTRNDYFLAGGDNYNFNGTLFGQMQDTCQGNFNLPNLAKYRYQRYNDGVLDGNFYFGPFSLLLYGAASFLYELMPSGTRNYAPDLYTISSFFGASQGSDGKWSFNNAEKIPDNWTNRVTPYDNEKVTAQIVAMYAQYPVLFGGNTAPGSFDALPSWGGVIQDGKLKPNLDAKTVSCLLYQLATERVPSSLNGVVTPAVNTLAFVLKKLGANGLNNLGCPIPLTK